MITDVRLSNIRFVLRSNELVDLTTRHLQTASRLAIAEIVFVSAFG
jgi:hypothetical protein